MKNYKSILVFGLIIVLAGCQHATKKIDNESNPLTLIAVNDVYRIAGINQGKTGGLARVRALRTQLQAESDHVLLLHAGDFLHPSFNSKQDDGRAMIATMNYLDGQANSFDEDMLVTFGNHEFDKGRLKHISLMNELLNQSEFTWLDSNIEWTTDGVQSDRLKPYVLKQYGPHQVGIFSMTTDMAHPEYIDTFDNFAKTAEHYVPMLRQAGADYVIALTHQTMSDDQAMMALPDAYRPDIIFGGHEHFAQAETVNGRWILKADADAASAVVVNIDLARPNAALLPQVVPLADNITPDPNALVLIEQLNADIEQQYCASHQSEVRCLQKVLGTTRTELVAEETTIRRYETNLGNLLADLSLHAFKKCDADVALLNSGSIRLNQNIPAGGDIIAKHLHEMFPYPSNLQLIEIPKQLLVDILQHSISNWTANGHWLQVAGLSFIHNPDNESASHIHLRKDEQALSENTTGTVRVVMPHYLLSANTDQDGYTMVNEQMIQECQANGTELKDLLTEYLSQNPQGINPKRDYRICNTTRENCLNEH